MYPPATAALSGISTGMPHMAAADGNAAKEINTMMQAHLPEWLYHFMTSDNIFVSALLPSIVIVVFSALSATLTQGFLGTIPAKLHDLWLEWNGFVERSVEVTMSSDYYVSKRMNDGLNGELQTAIKLYIGNNAADCHDTLARISLLETASAGKSNRSWSRVNIHRSKEDLLGMKIIVGPEPNRRFKIPNTSPTIFLKVEVNSQPSSNQWEKRQKTNFILTTKHTTNAAGRAHLDTFIRQCYEDYRATMDAKKKPGRYLYQLQAEKSSFVMLDTKKDEGGEGRSGDEDAVSGDIPPPSSFKRYRLSDDKDFDSLFFPGKKDILRLVDDFRHNRGKFAIEGFPRKLGLLLSGPSGTGKTAFVKALATYLGRHIITLPLEKIKTNQQLYDIMFEEMYTCTNTEKGKAEMIPNDKVIFLMEVDGAFDIVRSRKTDPSAPPSATSTPALTSDRMKDLLFNRADQLDLAGLLNALDGVVDSPGRVVIMSTSAVTELDAALVRPGRINRILHMNYLTVECAKQLLTHHFGAEAFAEVNDAFEAEWERKEEEAAAGGLSRTASYTTKSAQYDGRKQSLSASAGEGQTPLSGSRPATPQRSRSPVSAYANGSQSFTGAFKMAPAELEQLCIDNDTLVEVLEAFRKYPDLDELI